MINGKYFYAVFRIIIGLLFLQHGTSKLFGFPGGQPMEFMSLMGLAGVIELVVGTLLIFGLLTRLAAFFGAITMLIAYAYVHMPMGWHPLNNGGELALLYFAAFIVMLGRGAGAWSLEKAVFDKELI